MVKSKFTVLAEGREDIEDIPNAFAEFIEFDSPQGKMRLERTTRPAVLDKKTVYSKTSAHASNVEYIYSKDDIVQRFQAFRWDDAKGEWEEVRTPTV